MLTTMWVMRTVAAACLLFVLLLPLQDGGAQSGIDKSISDYRYFRALSIDLVGRPPADDEIAAFERSDFDLDHWIDQHLETSPYAERLRRIYMDALRLDLGSAFHFIPPQITLVSQIVLGPGGERIAVWFRHGQRRRDPLTDGEICLTREETGYAFPSRAEHGGTAKPIAQAVLDAKTVIVTPWWLTAGLQVTALLRTEPDGKTPITQVRICKEEAQTAESGTVFATGRNPPRRGDPLPTDRPTLPPYDTAFARAAKGRTISCLTGTGFMSSAECGCGSNLERCVPGGTVFLMPVEAPLGDSLPFWWGPQVVDEWEKMWWRQEIEHVFDRIFLEDRDFRDVLVGTWTEVNGPLAQFYRALDASTCCGPGAEAGYVQPEELVDPKQVPSLAPADTTTWKSIENRGPHAAGILTTPAFLIKYGSRRARAHALYSTFLCKDFVASTVKLPPSDEPNLMKRAGCSTCHQKLEPMAAFFTRVAESDWTWLPKTTFPISGCTDKTSVVCTHVYDPAFGGMLRSAYASTDNAEAGPRGLGQQIASSPELAPCVIDTVAQSFLGQPIPDPAWRQQLIKKFVDSGYHLRAIVRDIVTSSAYREAGAR
jgi:hypothetical protein